jgi:hypothetical protein
MGKKSNDSNYRKRLAKDKDLALTTMNMDWTQYRDAKKSYWELLTDPDFLSERGKGNVVLLIVSLLAVYFLDLLFSWNVAEYMAKQAFHSIPALMLGATLLFPLAYVVFEMLVNYHTHMAKREADDYNRDPGKRWVWIASLCVSIALAMVMPIAYVATGLAGMASTGNIVFILLLSGLALLAFLVHIMMIFSGDYMIAAKERLLFIWDHRRRRSNNQKRFHRLMQTAGFLHTLEREYQFFCEDNDQPYYPEPATPLVIYIDIYIAQDYHHIPFGDEPPMFGEREAPNLLPAGKN